MGTLLIGSPVVAIAGELEGRYTEPQVNRTLFGEELSMERTERDDYATHLAIYAVKVVRDAKGAQTSLELARNVLGLSLHLSPRNKRSLVVNAQLARDILPESIKGDYEADVFARLLLARGQLLEKQGGAVNTMLARYMIALSAIMNPRNEDAIYEAEIRRIDHGDISWSKVTGVGSGQQQEPERAR